jgi:hypothetical protein
MTKMQTRITPSTANRSNGSGSSATLASSPSNRTGTKPRSERYSEADFKILVEHDWFSQADLDALRNKASQSGRPLSDVVLETGVYTAEQIDLCLSTHDWWVRPKAEHDALVTSAESIAAYKHSYAVNGYFLIPHFFSREEFSEIDLAMQRMVVSHVDRNPAKHKPYHSLGGSVLYSQPAVTNINGHPSLLKIAQGFLGDDLVQGKYYLKVDDPYRYAGMFGHTHAETHFDCLSRGLYMFLYMDATTHDCGGFQIIPFSHGWYTRGSNGETLYRGKELQAESTITNKASLVHDAEPSHRWAGYETLPMPGNSLLVLSPFIWHAVRPVMHRRRLLFTGFFDAKSLTRDFVQKSDYFGPFPYDLKDCDLTLLTKQQRDLLAIHLDREAWLRGRGL